MKNHLQAYRFSEQEMNKMIELKGIFEQNGFEINRFPEVYYDTYDNYKKIYGKIKKPGENIDYLGVYTDFQIPSDEMKSKEGVIVKFKNRIEKKKENERGSFRFIVLMHELGHWLTHWATYNDKNWPEGFKSSDKKTHESLAQLIAYWAVDCNPTLENILKTRLTPPKPDDEYALYKNLIDFSKSIILEKLVEIRDNSGCSDDMMYDFLKSKTLCQSMYNENINATENISDLDEKFLKKQLIRMECNDSSTEENFPVLILFYFQKHDEFKDDKYQNLIFPIRGHNLQKFGV